MTIEAFRLTDPLVQLYRAIRQVVDELAEARGWTPSQLLAVRYISHAPDCTMRALTAHLRVTRAAVTAIVDHLEAQDLVRRQAGRDRRSFHLRLTSHGEAVLDGLRQELQARIMTWVGALPRGKAEALAEGVEALSALLVAESESRRD